MNVYPEEIADSEKSAKISSKMPEQAAGMADSSGMNPRGKPVLTAALVSSVALAMALGIWSLSRQLALEPASPEATALAVLPEKSIAVLPLENLSEDKQNAFLADGVQDDIRTALAKVADLKVINRTSVNTYAAGTRRNLREIAQTLGVAFVLEGSVRQSGEKVRISVQLTDARNGAVAWDESYERDLADVFAIQSNIVQRILSELQATVSPKEKAAIDERPAKDLIAYGPSGEGYAVGGAQRAISNDGRRIAWTWGQPFVSFLSSYKGLYVRDMVEEETVKIGGPTAEFQTMNSDGSRIFFT